MAEFMSQDEIDALLDIAVDGVERNPAQWKHYELEGEDVDNGELASYWYGKYLDRDNEYYKLREQVAAYRVLLAEELRKG